MVRESGADVTRREVTVEVLRKALVGLLRQRFNRLPAEVEGVIARTTQVDQLQAWLDRVIPAKRLEDVGIRT